MDEFGARLRVAREELQDHLDLLLVEVQELQARIEAIGPDVERARNAISALDNVIGDTNDQHRSMRDHDAPTSYSLFPFTAPETYPAVWAVFERTSQELDARQVHNEIVKMGWRTTSRTPINVVQATLSTLQRQGRLERVRRGVYRRRQSQPSGVEAAG